MEREEPGMHRREPGGGGSWEPGEQVPGGGMAGSKAADGTGTKRTRTWPLNVAMRCHGDLDGNSLDGVMGARANGVDSRGT